MKEEDIVHITFSEIVNVVVELRQEYPEWDIKFADYIIINGNEYSFRKDLERMVRVPQK